jgi:hypothetical protein
MSGDKEASFGITKLLTPLYAFSVADVTILPDVFNSCRSRRFIILKIMNAKSEMISTQFEKM